MLKEVELMKDKRKLNVDRFLGFANVYDSARPKCPEKVKEIILKYLGGNPLVVVDLGCGTGLSTRIWSDVSKKVIGIEPSPDMIVMAREKSVALKNVTFISAFSDDTGLEDDYADIITCSQSFHWMDPKNTLSEVDRVLRKGGIFAVYDYDWPPVCNLEAEIEYNNLFKKVKEIELTHPDIKESFIRCSKDNHLLNIKNSGNFKYVREILFSNSEICNAQRFISIALSQGGLQAIIKANIDEINPLLLSFQERIIKIYGNSEFQIDFCYRMSIGVK